MPEKMTINKAKRIVESQEKQLNHQYRMNTQTLYQEQIYIFSKGFIEGCESRDEEVKGLVEALENIMKHNDPPFIGPKWQVESKHIAKEALEIFRRSLK